MTHVGDTNSFRFELSAAALDGIVGGADTAGSTTGASTDAGKITFNPFSITRKIDRASPIFFQM